MAISRQQLTKELEPGLNALFGLEYNRYENEHAEIFTTESSDRAFEEEVMLSAFAGAPVKQEGAAVTFDQANEAYTARYTHETIALAFAITEEAIEDNLYDRLAGRYTRALARSMSHTKQVKAAAVLNQAQITTVLGGDGVPLISNAHPLANGGTFANVLATASDLNETSLEQILIDIAGFVDERGLKVAAQGRKMIIPKELQFTVPEGYRVNHFLTDSDSFYVLTDTPNGLKHFERSPLRTAIEGDFDTGNVRFKARERYSFGWSDPRCVFGNGNLPTS
jgi:hypothetical protein